MYEDALFMSNLFAFLAIPTGGERAAPRSRRSPRRAGARCPSSSADVSFRYPGQPGLGAART